MALWAGSTLNTNETASVFNQLNSLKALAIVRKKNFLLYRFLGKMDLVQGPKGAMTKFDRSTKITGRNIEVRLMGKLKTIGKLADGAEEVAAVALTHVADVFGGAEFPLTHYADTHPVPSSELDRFAGDEAKTSSFLDDIFEYLMLSDENTLGADIHSVAGGTAIGRKVMGSWCHAISTGGGDGGADGSGETGAAFRNYGTLDRQDAANADFRGIVAQTVGALTLAKLRAQINAADANGGTIQTGVAGTTLYTSIESLVEPYVHTVNSDEMIDFGGRYVKYAGVVYGHDQRAPASTIGLFDDSTWLFVNNAEKFTRSGLVVDPSKADTHVLPWKAWRQLICRKPNSNVKMLGVS